MVYDGQVSGTLVKAVFFELSAAGSVIHPGLSNVWGCLCTALPVCTAFPMKGKHCHQSYGLLKAHYGCITWPYLQQDLLGKTHPLHLSVCLFLCDWGWLTVSSSSQGELRRNGYRCRLKTSKQVSYISHLRTRQLSHSLPLIHKTKTQA